jgi:hypothetical protein
MKLPLAFLNIVLFPDFGGPIIAILNIKVPLLFANNILVNRNDLLINHSKDKNQPILLIRKDRN